MPFFPKYPRKTTKTHSQSFCKKSPQNSPNLPHDFFNRNRGKTPLPLDDAGLQTTSPALRLVIQDPVLPPIGKPDPGLIPSRKYSHTRGLHGRSQMHRPAVVPKKDAGPRKRRRTLTRRQQTAEIHPPPRPSLPPALRRKLARLALLRRPAQSQRITRIEPPHLSQQPPPILPPPVLRLHLRPHADRNQRMPCHRRKSVCSTSRLRRSQMEVPALRSIDVSIAQLRDIARKPCPLRLKRTRIFQLIPPHLLRERHANQALGPAGPEKGGIPASQFNTPRRPQINQHFRTPPKQLPPKHQQLARATCPDGVTNKPMHKSGVFKDCRSWWSLHIHRKVRQHPALRLRKGACDEVQCGKSYESVTEAAEAIDQNPFGRSRHVCL